MEWGESSIQTQVLLVGKAKRPGDNLEPSCPSKWALVPRNHLRTKRRAGNFPSGHPSPPHSLRADQGPRCRDLLRATTTSPKSPLPLRAWKEASQTLWRGLNLRMPGGLPLSGSLKAAPVFCSGWLCQKAQKKRRVLWAGQGLPFGTWVCVCV